jgi:hypothetical protein
VSEARAPGSPRPEAPGSLSMRRVLCVAGCVLMVALLFVGCGDSDSSSEGPDAGDTQDASGLEDAIGSDSSPGNEDAGDTQDASGLEDAIGSDSSPGNEDAGDTQDAEVPGSVGVRDCVSACETFLMTNCSTPAADFCESAQQSCQERYDNYANCQAELEAMDACAATQPVANFSCPLGTVPDEVRPYHVVEDVCVLLANALIQCMEG